MKKIFFLIFAILLIAYSMRVISLNNIHKTDVAKISKYVEVGNKAEISGTNYEMTSVDLYEHKEDVKKFFDDRELNRTWNIGEWYESIYSKTSALVITFSTSNNKRNELRLHLYDHTIDPIVYSSKHLVFLLNEYEQKLIRKHELLLGNTDVYLGVQNDKNTDKSINVYRGKYNIFFDKEHNLFFKIRYKDIKIKNNLDIGKIKQ